MFFKIGVLKNFADFALVFSCEICEIFKNKIFYRTPPVATSAFNDSLSSDKPILELFLNSIPIFK